MIIPEKVVSNNDYKMIWTVGPKPYTNKNSYVNPEKENGSYWKVPDVYIGNPEYEKEIKSMLLPYTIFLAITKNNNYIANIQNVENPAKVKYSLDGGTGGPTEDWVWNRGGMWNNKHDEIPTKEGYQFAGWYMDNETKLP